MIFNSARLLPADMPAALRDAAWHEADMDLLGRLSSGSLVYPAMLLLVGVATPIRAEHAALFWSVVAATAVALLIRFVVNRLRDRLSARGRNAVLAPLFVSLALTGGACGFLLLGAAVYYGFSSFTFALVMMWMAGIASGSTITFNPNFPLLLVQLVAVLVPVTVYEFSLHTSNGMSLGLATLVFLGFHVVQGRRLNSMYWDLRSTRALEAQRMQELQHAKSLAEDAQKRLHHQATHDTLTGVMNHAQVLKVMNYEMDRATRSGSPLGILMLDLDHFKQINDRFGHLAGDEVLRTIATRLRGAVRSSDFVGRYGGEEFLILMPGCSVEDCAAGAERIRRAIECEPVGFEGTAIQVTASLGVSLFRPAQSPGLRQMIAQADRALYQAKREGRNRVQIEGSETFRRLARGVRS